MVMDLFGGKGIGTTVAFNVINYFSHERSEKIDNVVLVESSNVLPLPFFQHGQSIRRDSSSGLFSSPYIGDLSNVDKLREFLRSSINKWGMKFTKLSDVLKEQKLLDQFFQCYEFQKNYGIQMWFIILDFCLVIMRYLGMLGSGNFLSRLG